MGSNAFRKLTLSNNRGNPLLGFFMNSSEHKRFFTEHDLDPDFCVKLGCMGMVKPSFQILVLACHNGRVLLQPESDGSKGIIVWDPIRNNQMALGYVPPSCYEWQHGNDTILCSRNHGESLTHCCDTAIFLVVWISTWRHSNEAQVMRYSSDLEEWEPWVGSTAIMTEIDKRPATLIGDILY